MFQFNEHMPKALIFNEKYRLGDAEDLRFETELPECDEGDTSGPARP